MSAGIWGIFQPKTNISLLLLSLAFSIQAFSPLHQHQSHLQILPTDTLPTSTSLEATNTRRQVKTKSNAAVKQPKKKKVSTIGVDDIDDDQQTNPTSASQGPLDGYPCLVLNADYQPLSFAPLSLWNWQDAIKAVFLGKVTVVDVYPDKAVRAAYCEFPLPSVIAVTDYVQPPQSTPAFTRRNVLLRDEYRCQYCRNRFHPQELSLDHVVPRSRGGRLTWTNAVASCNHCNGKKGCKSVAEIKSMGMSLYRKPVAPTQYQLKKIASRMMQPRRVHATWKPYLDLSGN